MKTPTRAAAALSVSNAVVGTHFTALNGVCKIPANSSFGYIEIPILESASVTEARFIGIQLDSSGSLKPSVNYNKLGLVIDQR